MRRGAIIENGVVVQIEPMRDGLTEIPENVYPGYTWDGETFNPPMMTEEVSAGRVRRTRDELLAKSDWTQLPDSPCDVYAWAVYRQDLRDVPQQAGFPEEILWPLKPE